MFHGEQRRFLTPFVFLGTFLLLTGCLRRVEVVTRERVDQTLDGNRGMIQGSVPRTPSTASPTRQYVEWDIEVPTYEMEVKVPEWRREWHDKELWGNRGYMTGGPAQKRSKKEEVTPPKKTQRSFSSEERSYYFGHPVPSSREKAELEKPSPPAPSYTTYTVKKGDTLGDISSKVYGTSRLWKHIYEANKDVLKDPNHVREGQVLRIPRIEAKMEPVSSGTIK